MIVQKLGVFKGHWMLVVIVSVCWHTLKIMASSEMGVGRFNGWAETTKFNPTSIMNGGGLRYHHNAKWAQRPLWIATAMKWRWSVPHFLWSSLEPQRTRSTRTIQSISSQRAMNIYITQHKWETHTHSSWWIVIDKVNFA